MPRLERSAMSTTASSSVLPISLRFYPHSTRRFHCSDSRAYASHLSSLDGHPGPPGEIGGKRISHSLECFEFEEHCERFCKQRVEKRNAHLPEHVPMPSSSGRNRVGWIVFDQDRYDEPFLCLALAVQPSPAQ
jgi:hypothetical protein